MQSTVFHKSIEWAGLASIEPGRRFLSLCGFVRELLGPTADEWFTLGNETASVSDATLESAIASLASAGERASWYEGAFVLPGGTSPIQALARASADGSQSLTLHLPSRAELDKASANAVAIFGAPTNA